jgi:hypothetical protein
MNESLEIFNDPVKLAALSAVTLNLDQLPMPTTEEIAQWSLSDHALELCAKEFVLMGAIGIAVTVMKNKSSEFYSEFISALAGHLSSPMFGFSSLTGNGELIQVIEKYIESLESSMVEFSHVYTNRVFGGNKHEVAIIVANLWKRAFDFAIITMGSSKQFFIERIAEEQLQDSQPKLIQESSPENLKPWWRFW